MCHARTCKRGDDSSSEDGDVVDGKIVGYRWPSSDYQLPIIKRGTARRKKEKEERRKRAEEERRLWDTGEWRKLYRQESEAKKESGLRGGGKDKKTGKKCGEQQVYTNHSETCCCPTQTTCRCVKKAAEKMERSNEKRPDHSKRENQNNNRYAYEGKHESRRRANIALLNRSANSSASRQRKSSSSPSPHRGKISPRRKAARRPQRRRHRKGPEDEAAEKASKDVAGAEVDDKTLVKDMVFAKNVYDEAATSGLESHDDLLQRRTKHAKEVLANARRMIGRLDQDDGNARVPSQLSGGTDAGDQDNGNYDDEDDEDDDKEQNENEDSEEDAAVDSSSSLEGVNVSRNMKKTKGHGKPKKGVSKGHVGSASHVKGKSQAGSKSRKNRVKLIADPIHPASPPAHIG